MGRGLEESKAVVLEQELHLQSTNGLSPHDAATSIVSIFVLIVIHIGVHFHC